VAPVTQIHIRITDKTFPAIDKAGPHRAIANLDFSLESGEFVCLVGPSGCGKTTLLNIIAGLDRDYEGDTTLADQHVQPKIGYVFQNPRLLPWRTVRENIELAMTGEQSSPGVDALLEAMQLSGSQHVYPERLSLGMSRRAAIIRAFAIDPELLLMDEPFVSLDTPTARQVRELLVKLWQQRPHTVLFVTHDLREAIALADRIIFLSTAPMTVVSEIRVPIPRNERNNENAIDTFRQHLIQNHPLIRQLL
jgi:ABC-type nitrate/sulfonate/bicarbonate transport system ATPase subunit